MHTDPDTVGHGAPPVEDEEMHVERSATPDGRLLLYFTFGPAAAQPRPDVPVTDGDAASGERQPVDPLTDGGAASGEQQAGGR